MNFLIETTEILDTQTELACLYVYNSLMATKVIDFPRGGEQLELPQRKRKRNERENIFNISEDEPATKRKSKKFKSDKTKHTTPVKPLIIERRRIPGWIHLKNVSEDTIVLGVVKEIQDVVVLVSLPYNLIGRIDVTDVSAVFSQNVLENEFNKSLQNIFYTGQFIVCRIKQVTQFISAYHASIYVAIYRSVGARLV